MMKVALLNEAASPAEMTKSGGNIYLEGVFIEADVCNNNKRIYPSKIIEREVLKLQPSIEAKRLIGELEHPTSVSVNLDRVSHIIEWLRPASNGQWKGRLRLIETEKGKIAIALIEAGVQLAISTRGVGSLSESEDQPGVNVVGEDYRLLTADLVHSPGAKNAFLHQVSEAKEYLVESGMYYPIVHMLGGQQKVLHEAEPEIITVDLADNIVKFIRSL